MISGEKRVISSATGKMLMFHQVISRKQSLLNSLGHKNRHEIRKGLIEQKNKFSGNEKGIKNNV